MKHGNFAVLISIVTLMFYVSNINVYAGEENKVTIKINKANYVFYEDSLNYYPDSNQVDTGILAKDVTVVLGGMKLTFPAEEVISI